MDDMQFSKYSLDIREILSKTDREGLENLVRNVVAYAQRNNQNRAEKGLAQMASVRNCCFAYGSERHELFLGDSEQE